MRVAFSTSTACPASLSSFPIPFIVITRITLLIFKEIIDTVPQIRHAGESRHPGFESSVENQLETLDPGLRRGDKNGVSNIYLKFSKAPPTLKGPTAQGGWTLFYLGYGWGRAE